MNQTYTLLLVLAGVFLALFVQTILSELLSKFRRNSRLNKGLESFGPIVAQPTPPNVDPLVAGLILDFQIDERDYVAQIVKILLDGDIALIRTKDGVYFEVLEPEKKSINKQRMLYTIFADKKTLLKKLAFSRRSIRQQLKKNYTVVVESTLFSATAEGLIVYKYRFGLSGVLIVVATVGLIVNMMVDSVLGSEGIVTPAWLEVITFILLGYVVGVILYTIIVVITSRFRPYGRHIINLKRALNYELKHSGFALLHELLCHELYLRVAEKDRLVFHHDPEQYSGQDVDLSTKSLPLAVCFGLVTNWEEYVLETVTLQDKSTERTADQLHSIAAEFKQLERSQHQRRAQMDSLKAAIIGRGN